MSLPRIKSENSNVVYFLRIDIKVFPTDFVFSTVAFAKNIVAPRVNTVTAEVTAKSNNLFISFFVRYCLWLTPISRFQSVVFYSSKVSNRWFIYLLGITIKEIANIQIIPPMWSRRKSLKKQNIIIIKMHIALITFRIIVSLFFSSIFLIILLCLFQKGRFKDNLRTW